MISLVRALEPMCRCTVMHLFIDVLRLLNLERFGESLSK